MRLVKVETAENKQENTEGLFSVGRFDLSVYVTQVVFVAFGIKRLRFTI